MGRCVFNRKWLTDYKWSKEVSNDKYSAFCTCCRKKIDLGKMGESALRSHARSGKHINNEKSTDSFQPVAGYFTNSNPQKSDVPLQIGGIQVKKVMTETAPANSLPVAALTTSLGSGVKDFVQRNDTQKAEILWTIQTVISHSSYKSNETNNKLFKLMFPDSKIAERFSCGEKKTAYLCVFGIAEHIKEMLKQDMKLNNYFVVMFDESLNKKSQSKQMDIHVRYWKDSNILTRYLGSQFMGHATANDMMRHFTEGVIEELKNNTQYMLQVSMDGPNVNWKFYENFKRNFKKDYDVSLINIGSCGLHIAHNAFKDGAESTGWRVSSVLSSLYYHFKDSPARREDFQKVTETTCMPLKFVSHRWLENVPVCERAITIWKYIVIYVDKVQKGELPKPTNKSYEVLASAVKDKLIIPKLEFFRTVAFHMQKFLREYQTDRPMVPFLYTDLTQIIENLMRRIMKANAVQTACESGKLTDIDLEVNENYLPYNKLDMGFSAEKALKEAVKNKVSERQVLEFRMECRSFILELLKKLLEKCPVSYSLVKHLSMLDPRLMKSDPESCKEKMKKVLTVLVNHNRIPEHECDEITQQFSNYLDRIPVFGSDLFAEFHCYRDRLDEFFCTHMAAEQYRTLLKVVKMLLLLSHGQASVERGFSVNKEVEVENLKTQSLVSQRLICDYVKSVGGIFNVPITKSLLQNAAHSRTKYDHYLLQQREEKKTAAETKKRKALEDGMEELKKKAKQIRLDHDALIKSADDYSMKAEKEQNLTHIAHANSLRQKAKEKLNHATQLDEKLEEQRKKLKEC